MPRHLHSTTFQVAFGDRQDILARPAALRDRRRVLLLGYVKRDK